MAVITISREYGSEGDFIARQVAQALGYHLVDQAFIGTILNQYGLVEFGKEYQSVPGFLEKFNTQRERRRDVMVDMLNQVVGAVAKHGNVVILGRSGFAILEGFADVLHVRIQAPFSVRVARVMVQQQISHEQAEVLVKESDRVRLAFIEEFYRVPWGATQAFDLVINTAKITPTLAVRWMVETARAFPARPPMDQPATASIEVDHILAAAVAEGLMCNEVHQLSQP